MVSAGDWKYTKDFSHPTLYDENQNEIGEGTLYLEGVKVSDGMKRLLLFSGDYKLTKNINVDVGYRFVDGLYGDYSILDDVFTQPDNVGALKLPSYGLLDLGLTGRVGDFQFRTNINNSQYYIHC